MMIVNRTNKEFDKYFVKRFNPAGFVCFAERKLDL
jgi:hypothetical protein